MRKFSTPRIETRKSAMWLCSIFVMTMLVACGQADESTSTAASESISEPESSEATTVELGDGESLYQVDTGESVVNWYGSKPIGDSHAGTIQISQGQLVADADQIVRGSFAIDMASLKDEENTTRLEGHLRSDDFFDVEKYPSSSLEITKVSAKNDAYEITGDMTIKGVTHEITFPATITRTDGSITANAEFEFDRSRWNVRYGSGSFFDDLGDKLISDEIKINVSLVARS